MLAEWTNVNAAKNLSLSSVGSQDQEGRVHAARPVEGPLSSDWVRRAQKSFRFDEESLHKARSERRRNVALVRRYPCKTYAFRILSLRPQRV